MRVSEAQSALSFVGNAFMHSGTDKSVPYGIYNNASEPIFTTFPKREVFGDILLRNSIFLSKDKIDICLRAYDMI